MSGTATCMQLKVPVRLTAMIAVPLLGGDVEHRGRTTRSPALVTRMLDRAELGPHPRRRPLDRRPVGDVDLDGQGRGALRGAARRPRPRPPSALRSSMATRWPSAASRRATPSPMPEAPPGDHGDPAHRVGLARRELEVQVGAGRGAPRSARTRSAGAAGRPVVLLGQADVPHPVEDPLDADPPLGPGQGAARAGVGPPAEGQVRLGVGPVDPELGRVTRSAGGRGWPRR